MRPHEWGRGKHGAPLTHYRWLGTLQNRPRTRTCGRVGTLTSAADGAQQVERLRQRKLLPEKRREEASAAYFATGFHAAIHHQQVAPAGRQGLSRGHIAEHHSPAREKLAGE